MKSCPKEQLGSVSIRREKLKPPAKKGDLKQILMPKPLFSQSFKNSPEVADGSAVKASKEKWDDLSSYLSDDSEHIHDDKLQTVKGGTSFLTSYDSNIHSHDHSVDGASSSIVGRFTVDKVQKIDIDSQSKRLDSESADNLYRHSDRFSRSSYVQPEFTLSGTEHYFNHISIMLVET